MKDPIVERGKYLVMSASFAVGIVLTMICPHWVLAIVDFPIGYSSRGGVYAFIALVDQQQLLEQEGIRANFVYVGGPQISHALVSGDIRMAILGPVTPLRAAAQGTDIRFIGGVTERESASLMADPKIASAAALKGTRLAIDRLGDTSDFRARKVLEALGLEPQKDVTLLQAGGQTARFAALKAGHAQSTIVDPPLTLVGRKMGFREIVKLTQLDFPSGAASIAVLRTTIDKQARELQAIMNAIARALRVYKTEKEVAIRGLGRFMQLNDREALEETWRAYAESYKDIPSPSVAGIKVIKEFLGQTDSNLRKLEIDKIIDTRFTSKLQTQAK